MSGSLLIRSVSNDSRLSLWVEVRAHQLIHILLLFLQFDNSILSKLHNQQPIIHFSMFCSLRDWFIWNQSFSFDILYFCLLRWAISPLCARRSAQCLDYQVCKNNYHWYSVEAHFQEAAGSLSLWVLPLKAGNISLMDVCNQSELCLHKMQSKKLLTSHWRAFTDWHGDCVAVTSATKCCQYIAYA